MTRTTPERIDTLPENGVFVFGSNAEGQHGAGAALLACERFGAVTGEGEGLQGQSYAIPTMSGLPELAAAAQRFIEFASDHPGLEFYLTKVGCGIAGHDESDVAPLFADAPDNVIRPPRW